MTGSRAACGSILIKSVKMTRWRELRAQPREGPGAPTLGGQGPSPSPSNTAFHALKAPSSLPRRGPRLCPAALGRASIGHRSFTVSNDRDKPHFMGLGFPPSLSKCLPRAPSQASRELRGRSAFQTRPFLPRKGDQDHPTPHWPRCSRDHSLPCRTPGSPPQGQMWGDPCPGLAWKTAQVLTGSQSPRWGNQGQALGGGT